MSRVYVVIEGPTEEAFVRDVLRQTLYQRDIYLIPRVIGRPGHQGGRVTYERAKRDVSLFLKQEPEAFCTTLFDLYGLGPGFPGTEYPVNLPNIEKVTRLEAAVKADILATLPASLRVDARFFPYVQLHEYEGLLFSDPDAFARGIQEPGLAPEFRHIRNQFASPEDINDDPENAPSKRIIALHPRYRKVLNGVQAASAVGIDAMRRECPHFNQWIATLERMITP